MSGKSIALAASGSAASSSQFRCGECANAAAGVAWVTRAVVTMPVARPRCSACSKSVGSRPALAAAASPTATVSSSPSTPARVFAPERIAVMVPAESGTCWLVL